MATEGLRQRLRGIYPAVPTPLTTAGGLDEGGLRKLIVHLLEGGVHGLWMLGSGGSFAVLTSQQRRQVTRIAVEEAAGRVPVLAGASDCATEATIANARTVADLGADGAFVVAPYYFFHTQDELLGHFEEVALEGRVPVMIYNNPINTKNGLTLESLDTLSRDHRILGVKDSSCDFALFQQLVHRFKDRPEFRIFQGSESTIAPSFLFGAQGAVLGVANVAPRLCVYLYEAAQRRQLDRLIALEAQFLDLLAIEQVDRGSTDRSFMGGIQAALELMGICGRTLAKPLVTFSEAEVAVVAQLLNTGLLEARSSQ